MRNAPSLIKSFVLFGVLFLVHSVFADVGNHTLSSTESLKKAQIYYQKYIFQEEFSKSTSKLERIERQVNAKKSFDSQDWYNARYTLQRVLTDNRSDFQAWFLYIRTLIELQQADTYQNYEEALEGSIINAFGYAQTDIDKAIILWTASNALHQFHDLRQKALTLASLSDIENHINILLSNYPKEFAPYFLDIPQRTDVANACISWTYPLLKTRTFHYEDFISLKPKVKDLGVVAKGNQLCLEGLNFGENYSLTMEKGFPGEHEVTLTQTQNLNIFIPHRKPSIRFRERGYILTNSGPQVVPFVAVNVQDVKIKIIHVPERNIQSVQMNWFTNQFSRWNADYLGEDQGEVVWQGTYRFPNEMDKTAISGLPIDKMIGHRLEPGVYVIQASLSDNSYDNDEFAFQALVISDIGLSTYTGPDGLHTFVRSLNTAKPLANVELILIARNNKELAKLKTESNGHVVFPKEIMNGSGGNTPAYITGALHGKQFTVLNLRNEAFDLSDRGVQGRSHSSSIDGYLYSERGIYRPGETVHFMSLLRDSNSKALTKLPLTLKIIRPDGVIAFETVLQDAGMGAYTFDYPISVQGLTGTWTAAIYIDPKASEISHTTFEVNDFVPPRIEIATNVESKQIAPHESNTIDIQANYYFGSPATHLKVDAESKLTLAEDLFPAWKGYFYGLEEESWTPQRFQHPSTITDAKGQAKLITKIDAEPQTTHVLQLETAISVVEAGGRARTTKAITPFWHQPYIIGITPLFKDRIAANNQEASFHIIALNKNAELLAMSKLRYTLYEEQHDYVWFRSGTHWQYEIVTRDKIVANGELSLEGKQPTLFKQPVKYGQYRLEILDEKNGIASSYRFSAGWFHAQEAPDRPDILEFKIENKSKNHSDFAHLFVKSPFAGELTIIEASTTLRTVYTGKIGKEGFNLDIPIKEMKMKSGSYFIATVFRGSDEKTSQMPGRAIGVAWLENTKAVQTHKIDLSLDAPSVVKSGQSIEVKVKNNQKRKDLRLAVALVDEGTLSLVDYQTPDPFAFYFSQQELSYLIRDSYGLLINPYGARPGSFEVGGGETIATRALTQLPVRAFKVVSLFSGIIDSKGQETITIPFTIPEFSGKLRVMAVAWDETGLGNAQSYITVKDDIDLYLTLPRFLAANDQAEVPLVIKNLNAPLGEYHVDLQGADHQAQNISLDNDKEIRLPLKLSFPDNGIKNLTTTITGPNNFKVTRNWQLSVRSKIQSISKQQYGKIDSKKQLTLDTALLKDFNSDSHAIISIGTVPSFGSDELIDELLQYPYYCLEQTLSRLLASALANKPIQNSELEKGLNQLSSLQKIDGSFSLWSLGGSTEPWLSLYAADVLHIMNEKGLQVPSALTANLSNWIKEIQQRGISQPQDISLIAYAHYLRAKQGHGDLRALRFFVDNNQAAIIERHDRAFIAAAFAYYGDAEMAKTWFDKALIAAYNQQYDAWGFGSDLRNLAILVSLLAEATQNHSLIMQQAMELMDKAKSTPYLSTQEKAWLIRAERALKAVHKPYHVSIADKNYQNSTPFSQSFSSKTLESSIVINNHGDNPVYYALTLAGEPLNIETLPQAGFDITREVYALNGEVADLSTLKSGEQYVVVIKGRRQLKELHHVLVVDLLPAGFEIEKAKLVDNGSSTLSWLPHLSRASRIEGRDDRFVAAFELGDQNDFTTAYLVRAISGGTFTYPATFVEAMYQPQYFKYAKEQQITIATDF
jgi:uncharacterized protein YfaS (alpha-2-macroglobulin family)